MTKTSTIIPVILSGGAGTRLWPSSREAYPKQFLPLLGDASTFEETLHRVSDRTIFAEPMIVTGEAFRFLVADQFARAGVTGRIVLEPMRRDSGPAIAVAAELALATDPDAILLVLAADHHVTNPKAFVETAAAGRAAADLGAIVTFGITPDKPAIGYGYINPGDPIDARVHRVAAFVEKPDAARARTFIERGYLWNSGNFLFRADVLIGELERFEPEMARVARDAAASISVDRSGGITFEHIDRDTFAASPQKSIDFAVMERTDRAAVIAANYGWSDLGSWEALWDMSPKDAGGNAARGAVTLADTTNSFVMSEDIHTAVVGLDGVAVITTKDAVLVAPRGVSAELKPLVATLTRNPQTRPLIDTHTRVLRPWGSYETVDRGERFLVKRIIVRPGAQLSLQKHLHRSEHWVVVSGTATVVVGERTLMLRENESTFIPVGEVHRLSNEGRIDLELVEVQTGSYLAEDDIIRLEDVYNRA